MDSEEKEEKQNYERVKIYINIEPLGLKIGYVFKKSETFQSIINFVFNQVKKLGVKFELGRINENKTGAILLTENIIGDFLENNDEITVYSEEYGFTRANLPGENEHSSLKRVFYLKSVSDLYKSMNFLKKKRNEKLKQKNLKKEEKKDDKKEETKKGDEEEKEEKEEQEEKSIDIDEEKEEKKEKEKKEEKKDKKETEKNIQKSNKKNNNQNNKIEKTDEKNKTEKKEKKTEEKEKNRDKEKNIKKTTEKKEKKHLTLDDEDDESNE